MATFNIKKILVPVDFSATSERALEQAVFLAKTNKAQIVMLNCVEGAMAVSGPDYFGVPVADPLTLQKHAMNWARKHMEALKNELKRNGAPKVSYLIKNGSPYRRIMSVAEAIKPDIIVMGTHGVSGIQEFLAGSNTFKVVSHVHCPVLSVQRAIKKAGFKNIVVPFRNKAHSREKVDYAIHIAKLYGATMHVLGISYDKDKAAIKKMEFEAQQIKKIAEKSGVKTTEKIITGSYTSKAILAYAYSKKADLLVTMADTDKEGLADYFIGSVSQQLVNHSHIPVLSVHPDINPKLLVGTGDWTFWV